MLQIILLLLKIIGIIIALLLGIIFFLLFVILVVPIRYKGIITYQEVADGEVTISWLLRILTIKIDINKNKFSYRLHFFGKKWLDSEKNIKKPLEQAGEIAKDTVQSSIDEIEDEIDDSTKDTDKVYQENTPICEETQNVQEEDDKKETKKNFFGNIKKKYKSIKNKILAFWVKVKGIPKKIKKGILNILSKKEAIQKVLLNEDNRKTFLLLWKQLLYLLKHLKPKKFTLFVAFGFDNPAQTGQVLAFLSSLMPFYEDHIALAPNFQEKQLEGNLYAQGSIRLLVILIIAIRIMTDKNIHKLRKQFLK